MMTGVSRANLFFVAHPELSIQVSRKNVNYRGFECIQANLSSAGKAIQEMFGMSYDVMATFKLARVVPDVDSTSRIVRRLVLLP